MEKIINGIKCTLCKCEHCGQSRWKPTRQLKKQPRTYCSQECLYAHRRTGKVVHCSNPDCDKSFYRRPSDLQKSKSGDNYCSRRCATIVNNSRYKTGSNHGNWKDGTRSYRRIGLTTHGKRCANPKCPLGNSVPTTMLDVHHIDGDHTNYNSDNLVVLCVWCHALITRKVQTLNNIRGIR